MNNHAAGLNKQVNKLFMYACKIHAWKRNQHYSFNKIKKGARSAPAILTGRAYRLENNIFNANV